MLILRSDEEKKRLDEGKNIGSFFESWLDEEGVAEEVTVVATRRAPARQLATAKRREGMTKIGMALKMGTGRGAPDRLPELDADEGFLTARGIRKTGRRGWTLKDFR